MGAEAGDASGAVGGAPHVLAEQALVPEGFEYPPAGLDVIVIQGHVRVVHVHPVADAVGQGFPLLKVVEDALPALLVEFLDAVLFDVPLAGEAQALLHLQLHRQPVGVPAAFAQAAVPLHRPVAADDILEYPGQHVMDAGTTVGSRRPLEEHE